MMFPQSYFFCAAALHDVQGVLNIMQACDLAMQSETDVTAKDIMDEWKSPDINIKEDTRIIITPDSEILGYAIVNPNEKPTIATLDVYIHPDYWQDDILSPALMAWAEARARQHIASAPDDARVTMQGYTYANDTFYKSVLERAGMTTIRHFFRMMTDLNAAQPAPVWPAGITVRSLQAGEDLREVFSVRREAFKAHWGEPDMPFDEQYLHWQTVWGEDITPSYWFLAYDGAELVGICLALPEHGGDEQFGWIRTLGVRASHRGRGIGSALLHHAFGVMFKDGKTRVGLGVDASNTTGAVALYEKAGMRVWSRFDLYEKELRPGRDYTYTDSPA